jgi:hypothetical protein
MELHEGVQLRKRAATCRVGTAAQNPVAEAATWAGVPLTPLHMPDIVWSVSLLKIEAVRTESGTSVATRTMPGSRLFGSSHSGAVRKRDDNRLRGANECLVD